MLSVFRQLSKPTIVCEIVVSDFTSFCAGLFRSTFSPSLDETVESWGIRILRSPIRMPTTNAYCERVVGTIRRECLDYVIPLSALHLRRTLREWISHYNSGRPHRSLGPGIPDRVGQLPAPRKRADQPHRASGVVIAKSILGGLHHVYRWANAA